jgi:hypothetical protein
MFFPVCKAQIPVRRTILDRTALICLKKAEQNIFGAYNACVALLSIVQISSHGFDALSDCPLAIPGRPCTENDFKYKYKSDGQRRYAEEVRHDEAPL